MKTYRFTLRHEHVTTVDIEAEDELCALEQIELYLEDGGTGDANTGYWNSRYWDEDYVEICPHCDDPKVNQFGIPCCSQSKEHMEKEFRCGTI